MRATKFRFNNEFKVTKVLYAFGNAISLSFSYFPPATQRIPINNLIRFDLRLRIVAK